VTNENAISTISKQEAGHVVNVEKTATEWTVAYVLQKVAEWAIVNTGSALDADTHRTKSTNL
jgi:hypothetical protein